MPFSRIFKHKLMATPTDTKTTPNNNTTTPTKENPPHETASSHGATGSPRDSSTGGLAETAIAPPPHSNDPISETFKIPSYSRWFSWEGIHGTERRFLPEFFDGKSTAKNPRVYKEHRDFIIGKYRENPQKKITFTEVRRMLVGDVNTVKRVFDFLESWGLINYQAITPPKQQQNNSKAATALAEANNTSNSMVNGSIGGENVGDGKVVKGLVVATDGRASTLIDGKRGLASSDGKGSKEKRGVFCNACGVECSKLRYDCLKEVIKPKLEDEIPPEEPGSSATDDGIAEGLKAFNQDPEKQSSPKPMEVDLKDEKNSMDAETNGNKEQVVKKPDKLLRCPRCDSSGTKFCYYNNYNVNQPRYFCKNCQRYWTAGGTMRNVPIGAGRRKNRHSGSDLPSVNSEDAAYGQAGYVLCPKCYVPGNYGPGLAASDFKRVEIKEEEYRGVEWTNQEMLLLLEAIMVFNDDWKHVAQHVGTKCEAECVTKFIQLPFGEQYMGNDGKEASDRRSSNNNIERIKHVSSRKVSSMQEQQDDANFDEKHYTDDDISGPPLKRRHLTPFSDASNPIMAQVAFLSAMAGSHIAEAAAKAAVAALCEDDLCGSQTTGSQESKSSNKKDVNRARITEELEKDFQMEDGKEELHGVSDQTTHDEEPLSCLKESTTMMKGQAVTATVMESATVRAKLSLDQEERETEQLFSTIIDTKMKKLQEKIQHFNEMEVIMENEHSQVEQINNLLFADRLQFLNETMKLRFLGNQGKEIDGT